MKKHYTSEEKETIIKRHIVDGESYLQIYADTKISKSTFYNWIKQYNLEVQDEKKNKVNYRNYMQLEKRLNDLKMRLKF